MAILNETSKDFLDKKKNDKNFTYSSCVTYFYDSFYMRLFDIHPMSKNLFKNGMRSQGKFLVKMITLALSEINDSKKFDKTLVKLAEVHNERGVKAVEYGVVGEVLFYVMKKIIGPSNYGSKIHMAWVKVYSRMLRIIVPTAVALELETGSSFQLKRLSMADSVMFETSKSADASGADGEHAEPLEKLQSEKVRLAEATLGSAKQNR